MIHNIKPLRIVATAAAGTFWLTQQVLALPEQLKFNMVSDSFCSCSLSQRTLLKYVKKKWSTYYFEPNWHGSKDVLVIPPFNELSWQFAQVHSPKRMSPTDLGDPLLISQQADITVKFFEKNLPYFLTVGSKCHACCHGLLGNLIRTEPMLILFVNFTCAFIRSDRALQDNLW